jgi:hypothetical protein
MSMPLGDDEPVVMLDPEHGGAVRLVHGVPYVPFASEAGVDLLRAHFTPAPADVFVVTRCDVVGC